MALIGRLNKVFLDRDAPHLEAECTYSVLIGPEGDKQLQLDTYGSSTRKIKGKKSQSIRLSGEAVEQLKLILAREF